MFKFNDKLI